jgi:hypothetical protein
MRTVSVDQSSDNRESRVDPESDRALIGSGEFPIDSDTLPSIGDYLARQRQLRGISRDDLCNLTQIPLRSLVRLESGVFDQLDDGFVRGFVRTVAEALGLDPDDTLARMTREPVAINESPRAIATLGLMRAGVLFAALALILISVGLVSVAVQYVPGRDADAPVVMRRDPVRALAEARVGPGFNATQVLDPAPPPKATATESAADPDRLEPASPGVPPAPVETLRVDVRASEP